MIILAAEMDLVLRLSGQQRIPMYVSLDFLFIQITQMRMDQVPS